MPARRISGKDGAIWLQVGSTAVVGQTSLIGNASAEVVDGITYDPYQVWTNSVPANIPMDPGTEPTLVVGGTGLPSAYTNEWRPLLGKFIYTPSLGSAATVDASDYSIPKLFAQGDLVDLGIDVEQDVIDASAMGQNWKSHVVGLHGWSGSANVYWKNSTFWDASAAATTDAPIVMRFYPQRGVDEYWYGMGFLNWGIKVATGDSVKQALSISGDQGLYLKKAA